MCGKFQIMNIDMPAGVGTPPLDTHTHSIILHTGLRLQFIHQVSSLHVWQSRVEIEGYSVAYFDRIAVFEALHR